MTRPQLLSRLANLIGPREHADRAVMQPMLNDELHRRGGGWRGARLRHHGLISVLGFI